LDSSFHRLRQRADLTSTRGMAVSVPRPEAPLRSLLDPTLGPCIRYLFAYELFL
jgi:hypothetical protein